jgi:hypothetical protein
MSVPTLLTVKQFNQKHPAFPIGGLRHHIFHEGQNGMKAAGVVIRNGTINPLGQEGTRRRARLFSGRLERGR